MQIISYIHMTTQRNLRKERKSNKEHTAAWFCLHKVHKQAKLIYGIRIQGSGCLWRGRKGHC